MNDFVFQAVVAVGAIAGLLLLIPAIVGVCWLRDKIWPPCKHDWQPTGKTWITDEFSGGPGSKGSFMGAMGEWLHIEERCTKCGAENISGHWN